MEEKFDQFKYQNKYNKEKYDKFLVLVPKGDKERIEEHRKNKGFKSLNEYMKALIYQDMNGGGTENKI